MMLTRLVLRAPLRTASRMLEITWWAMRSPRLHQVAGQAQRSLLCLRCADETAVSELQEQHRLVGPGEEASLNFWFQPDQSFPAREFQASPGHLLN